MESLERLQGLHADLIAFAETRLANIDRLWQELQQSLTDFKKLLDKPTATGSAREAYNAGKIVVDDEEYAVTDEFRHFSRAVGTVLELDEIEAGRTLIESHAGRPVADETFIADTVRFYHDRRDLLLQDLRMVLQESLNLDHEDGLRLGFQDVVAEVLDIKTGPPSNGSAFAMRCMTAMEEIEKWQSKISEQIQSRAILSQVRGPEFYATLEFQRDSLFKQHEAMGAILALLFRGNYTISEDVRKLHNVTKRWQRLDIQLIHYLPAFSAGFRQYGSPEGSTSQGDAASLNASLTGTKPETLTSFVRPFEAVLDLWWIVEYSGWFREPVDRGPEDEQRTLVVKTSLEDNALEFLLSVCSSVTYDAWRHPARQELVALLLSDGSGLVFDSEQTSTFFRNLLMECFESFAEAWITNMPDSIRRLKSEEDDRRLLHVTALHDGLGPNPAKDTVQPLHLECFLVLMSFAFEQRPLAAEQFWEDPDSNLYGFLQWASRRQTVPRVSAFCEMMCSISEGPECAASAHKFLLDESVPVSSSRTRRMPSINYQQMFAELELYARKVHERSSAAQVPNARTILPTDMNELESPVMLSCYLRLLAHLCRQLPATRQYIFGNSNLDFPRVLLLLCSGPIPNYLRASVFSTLDSLLTDKDAQTANAMWRTLDEWASNGHDGPSVNLAKPEPGPIPSLTALETTFSSIAISFDQFDAFLILLRNLLTPCPDVDIDGQALPFPIDLGSSYRTPGISPYIDFVCGQLFVKRIRELGDESQVLLSSFHCLDLIAIVLETFNESYVAMLDKTMGQADTPPHSAIGPLYAQRHPFARVMQWLLSAEMNKTMMKTLHVPADDMDSVTAEDPLIANLQRCIDIMNMVLDLQPTYFDIVRPLTKDLGRNKVIQGTSGSSIEDIIAAYSAVILDLCQYSATAHPQLALRSLALLQKLSASPKLNNHFLAGRSSTGRSRRIIDMLGANASIQLLPVSDALARRLHLDVRELEDGFVASGYLTKDGILAFLNACLSSQPTLPNIAHLLLGFDRVEDRLVITPAIDEGTSVFNAISELVQNYPDGQDGSLLSWLVHIKSAGIHVLQSLWSSPISSDLVMGQLRRLRFLQSQFIGQAPVMQANLWDGKTVTDSMFWHNTSAEALAEFLSIRASLYDFIAKELRITSRDPTATPAKQILSTLRGTTTDFDGSVIPHLSFFDMFDFADIDMSASLAMPELEFYGEINLDSYMTEETDLMPSLYNIGVIRELLQLYQLQFSKQPNQMQGQKPVDQDQLEYETDGIIGLLEARNRWTLAQRARIKALNRYVEAMIAVVECCQMEDAPKAQFILRMLQLILPKLDTYILDEAVETIELARAADTLLSSLPDTLPGQAHNRVDNMITDRLFQLFRICIEGISMSNSSTALRATLYSICCQYLTRIAAPSSGTSESIGKARTNSMDCVRSASVRLISTLSDDAEDGTDTCRLNALNLLGLLTCLARTEKSNLLIDLLTKANVLDILIEPLKHVATEFQAAEANHRAFHLSIFETRMLFLLQVSRTREGAGALLGAGFMQAIRNSLLFRADPDLGMSLTTDSTTMTSSSTASASSALYHYFVLLASTLRVLLSVFLSRGRQNEQAQYLVRTFLQDYRANMVGVFKKAAGVNGKMEQRSRVAVEECVRCYTGLCVGSGFVDFEDESALEGLRGNGFS